MTWKNTINDDYGFSHTKQVGILLIVLLLLGYGVGSSHRRSARGVSELQTLRGVQYLTQNMNSKAFVREIRQALLFASPKTNMLVKYQPNR